ncbi:MAG: hypothetical protein J0H68_03065 [Sphingobacteriia bacterium]|nr:hypothetical protein [Sphingobacteriia bacterium]
MSKGDNLSYETLRENNKALIDATANNNLKLAKSLLKKGASKVYVNASPFTKTSNDKFEGTNALIEAVKVDNLDLVKAILSEENVNLKHYVSFLKPLYFVKSVEVAKFLLESGVHLNTYTYPINGTEKIKEMPEPFEYMLFQNKLDIAKLIAAYKIIVEGKEKINKKEIKNKYQLLGHLFLNVLKEISEITNEAKFLSSNLKQELAYSTLLIEKELNAGSTTLEINKKVREFAQRICFERVSKVFPHCLRAKFEKLQDNSSTLHVERYQ